MLVLRMMIKKVVFVRKNERRRSSKINRVNVFNISVLNLTYKIKSSQRTNEQQRNDRKKIADEDFFSFFQFLLG